MPAPQKSLRTQAQRSASTKMKILDAVVECIAERGIKGTTSNVIAERAGVTWGALQHHFGGKNGAMAATLEYSYSRFVDIIGTLPDPKPPLKERVALFVDRSWLHYSSPHYRSMFLLLQNDLPEFYGHEEWAKLAMHLDKSMNQLWRDFFADLDKPAASGVQEPTLQRLAHYTHCVLSGLAMTQPLAWASAESSRQELDYLKKTLVEELQ